MKAKITPKKKKTETLAKLKKKCDVAFSKYIRLRDADEGGTVQCCTCGVLRHWKDRIDCGHYISRTYLSLRYSDINCAPQCKGCNAWGGEKDKHALYLERTYGHGILQRLDEEKNKTVKFTKADYQEMIDRFTEAV